MGLDRLQKKNTFIKEFNKFYDTKVLGYPSFIIFEDGKVKDILTVKVDDKLRLTEVIKFLDSNDITVDNYD